MMRITDKISNGTFLNNNRRLRGNLLGSYDRIMSQRRFNRVSEDSINGAKAMIIRRDLRDLDIYASNLSSVKQLFTEAETNLYAVAHDKYISVEEQLTAATNGTYDQLELNSFSTTLDQIADGMVETLNADFSERRIFGGTNNSSPAFEIGRYCVTDENNTVVYPPYFYDYYVGADSTKKQVEDANEALATLAKYNARGNTADDEELTSIKRTLEKVGIVLHVTDGNKYSAEVKTDNNRGDMITVLAYGGEPQEITYSEAENPVIAEVETVVRKLINNSVVSPSGTFAISDEEKEVLAKLGITFETDVVTATVIAPLFKDSKGIILDPVELNNNGLPASIKDNIPKEITVKAGGTIITQQNENDVKAHLALVDVPRAVTYNGIPVDFDVMHKMTRADGTKVDMYNLVQSGAKLTIKKLNSDFTWDEGKEITPDVSAAVKGRDNSLIFPGSEPIYVDIGIGIKYDKDNDYEIDPQTALDTAFNGASITGCGLDDDGYSKNLVQLVLEAARALRNGDRSTPNAIIDKANLSNDNILIKIAELGSKQNSIEFYEQRNEDSKKNLRERQNIVEGTDMETEISYFESLLAAYEASLKVGTQVIPNSIFNYI